MTTLPSCILSTILLLTFVHPLLGNMEFLKALRDSFIDTSVPVSSWFDPETSPCNWSGIKCDDDETVSHIGISCSVSPISLPFPRLISEFKSLKHLNLSHCAFTGEIYPEFWDLVNLQVLDLSGNRLSGTIPPTISKLKQLRQLILDDNNFSGSLPSSIAELVQLKELSLHSNSFSGNLPEELGELTLMQSLDISSNFFSGNLPSSLGNLTKLLYFTARDNMFSGHLFPEICNLKSLQILDLASNSLTGPIPSTIRNFKDLTVVDLQDNRFTGNVPQEIAMLNDLSYLNLAENDFNGELPSSIGKLLNLVYFIASQSGLKGKIPSELGNCKKLRLINLSFNSLTGRLPDSLARLESINSFILGSNRLSGPVPMWISNWKKVHTIILSQNQLTGPLPPLNLPSLFHLDISANILDGELSQDICKAAPSLTRLVLSHNNFSGNITHVFNNCLNLTELILSDNHISGELPGYLGRLQLVNLELAKNRLSGYIPDQIWESKTLMEIILNGNLLEGLLSGVVGNTSTLERLQVEDNLLTGSIPSSIGKLKNLTNLSLRGNKLTGDIPSDIFECTKLVSLDLGSNMLTGQIPVSISNLKLLDNLVLSDNRFSGPIPEEICSGFQKVPLPDSEFIQHYGMLDLSHNELEGPIPRTIKNCLVVKEILLQGNWLNGSIPEEISLLANLTLLDLSFNLFSGPVLPQLFLMVNLQGLVLSHNQLNGFVPDNIWLALPSVAKVDLSNNDLRGPLPASLLEVKSLTYLDVSNNQFSGKLEHFSFSNLVSLSVLDLHNNVFSGSVPPSLSDLASLTYLDLSGNNFRDAFPCKICTIQGLMYSNFSGNSGNFPDSCMDQLPCIPGLPFLSPKQHSLSSYASVSCVVIAAIAILMFLLWKTRQQEDIIVLGNVKGKLVTTPCKLLEPLSINVATFEHPLLRIKAADISSATENFSRSYIIGDGGFGTVYRAALPGGRTIAVKRLNGGHVHGEREFLAEMETIGKVKHENLVPLLGYCAIADERFLIYEYMENGSLDFWLRNEVDLAESLDWPTRFNICLGSARGLAFLHHGFVPHIIHRDIKSSNILLDRDFEPRVSDFGLARIISECESHVSTALAGTLGYIPPEYGQAMVATTKGDVYSFGVVMLELVTGRAPTGQADVEGGNLVGWVRWMVGNGKEGEVLDPSVSGPGQMERVLSIARACTIDEPWMRPTMLEVVKLLKQAKKLGIGA